MAKEHSESKANTANLQSAEHITLDQLISSTSQSVLRVLGEHQSQQRLPGQFNPRIWVGYWVEYQHVSEAGQATVPAVGGISRGGGQQ